MRTRALALLSQPTLAFLVVGGALSAACVGSESNPGLARDTDSGGSSTHDSGSSSSGASEAGASTGADAQQQQPTTDGASPDAVGGSDTGTSSSGGTGAVWSDNFDEDTASMPPPAPWTTVMGCNPYSSSNPYGTKDTDTAAGGGYIIGIDSSQHHSGANSLRIVGGDSCGYYAVTTGAFTGGKLGSQVYVRLWAMFSMSPTAGHNGFLSFADGTNQLRMGFQGNVIDWNWYGSDTTLPDIDSQGEAQSIAAPSSATGGQPTLAASTWACLEFHVDQTNGQVEFWFNGAQTTVPGLTYTGTSTQGVNDQWGKAGPTSLALTSLGLGYLQLNDMMTVWFDDVSLGNSRIGCN
jgi:hypothetical protein